MGMLDSLLGGGAMQQNPFAQYQKMQANPFTRMIPGSEYLSGIPGQQSDFGFINNMGNGMGGAGENTDIMNTTPTDFAGVPPGLPNLPQDMQGFGFGSAAPEMNVNNNLRQNLIQQLLKQLMSQGGMGDMDGMGGMNRSGI